LQQFATQRKLDYKQDSTGNMVIKRPGSGGGEAAPTVVIQVHFTVDQIDIGFAISRRTRACQLKVTYDQMWSVHILNSSHHRMHALHKAGVCMYCRRLVHAWEPRCMAAPHVCFVCEISQQQMAARNLTHAGSH